MGSQFSLTLLLPFYRGKRGVFAKSTLFETPKIKISGTPPPRQQLEKIVLGILLTNIKLAQAILEWNLLPNFGKGRKSVDNCDLYSVDIMFR